MINNGLRDKHTHTHLSLSLTTYSSRLKLFKSKNEQTAESFNVHS